MSIDSAVTTVEVVRAECPRFRYPLVLLHGLWAGAWIWREVAPYLGHRGWDAWVPSFVASGGRPMDLEARRVALGALVRELPGPPILVTHDAGLALADLEAVTSRAPAVIAIAPIVGLGPLGGPRLWMTRLAGRVAPIPGGRFAETFFAGLADYDRARIGPDSGSVLRAAISIERRPVDAPRGLVVASDADLVAPLARCERFAKARGWDIERHGAAGHFPMLGRSATALGDRLHRWLVRALGGDLLAWIDDEEEGK